MLHHTTYLADAKKPWVTFIHGAGGSSAIWYKQIRDFRKDFNVLLIDLRGHGRSKDLKYESLKSYTFKVIGDDVLEVLNHLKIEKTHLVGISLGTIIARDLAERYAYRVQSMIMGGAVMKLNLRGQILMRIGAMFKSVIPYLLLYRFFAYIIMPRKKHRESRNFFIKEAKKLYQKEFKRWFTLIAEVNPLLRFFRYKENGIPTLYIMGSEDYMFLPPVKKLVAEHQLSTLFVIEQCGHVVNLERPEVFNETAIGFLGGTAVGF